MLFVLKCSKMDNGWRRFTLQGHLDVREIGTQTHPGLQHVHCKWNVHNINSARCNKCYAFVSNFNDSNINKKHCINGHSDIICRS